jgi:cephalosporin hydroxylase
MKAEEAPFRRRLDYERRLLPNPHMAVLESGGMDSEGMTIGYPAWNLLYYSMLCSIPPELPDAVVVETGTNLGMSTIAMAQALEDIGVSAVLQTVDINKEYVEKARRNVTEAGLAGRVEFHVGESLSFLSGLVGQVDHIDFVFLDDLHRYQHVVDEVRLLHPKLLPRQGKVYFDNTTHTELDRALRWVRRELGGNLIEFESCSWSPPGNAIWQPD